MQQFFRNVLDFQKLDEGIVPLRFSKSQMAFFEPLPYKFLSYNAAGICLDFVTDSPFFQMSYRVKVKPETREHLYFDIFVEDRLVAFPSQEIYEAGAGEWTVELPIKSGNPKRVTVYLPYLAEVMVEKLGIAEHAIWKPAEPYKKNLLCLGDSITQGMNAVHPSSTYAVQLSRSLKMNLLNQAVSGYIFNAETIDRHLQYKPDLITVAYGTNDWSLSGSYEEFRENAAQYIQKLVEIYPEVIILVLSPLWRSDHQDLNLVGEFTRVHKTLEQLCSNYSNVHYVDGFKLTPNHSAFFGDGLHPTDEGFLHMTLSLLKKLNQLDFH